MGAGALAVLRRRPDVTMLALVAGAIGVVLYAGATAAVGFLLGWITLARLVMRGNAAREQ